MPTTHPYYLRSKPTPLDAAKFASDSTHIDLQNAHMEPYGVANPVAEANLLFDKRAAAAISDAVGPISFLGELLEVKSFGDEAPEVRIPRAKCLAIMAYPDYFPSSNSEDLWRIVSEAILGANSGWCGTFGPGVDGLFDLAGDPAEGNYDMSQMHLLQLAYRYYDELTPEARELLITVLLAKGRIHRPNRDDMVTSRGAPDDWSRAGFVHVGPIKVRIGETENHILTIHTARYLTNQLLYQRDYDPDYDNRRNRSKGAPTCTELMLSLLRNILRGDFSEYNAKPYQTETRSALLNLCSYAYDHEVRLAARMVLDYISAHIAVSSNDLRRMVPFRRLNKDEHVTRLPDRDFMDVGLLETSLGADPMAEPFAIQAGNTRAYQTGNVTPVPPNNQQARPWDWAIAGDAGAAVAEALSDYRLPPSIHDLFVNDLNRRFFQRLHRFKQLEEVEGAAAVDEDAKGVSGRNADNMEIYAGSPSYLITAGGAPATYAIDPGPALLLAKGRRKNAQQLGVAVTTSFMPTGQVANPDTQNNAKDLIQFGRFSDTPGEVANYGVAPDFACGHKVHLPLWVLTTAQLDGQFLFVDRGSPLPDGNPAVITEPAGFYLAIFNEGEFVFLEAFDTWLHPGVTFQAFKKAVQETNPNIVIQNNVAAQYTTQNGNQLHFVIWKDGVREDDATYGARILRIEYGAGDPADSLGDAGNISDRFLNGTVINSFAEAVVQISNPALGTNILLDMNDQWHPRRTSETGEVEEAGNNHEVWVDFSWQGPTEGDFFHPFNTIADAAAAVADGGVIKIMPGTTSERPSIHKRVRVVAPIGGVKIGAH